MDGTQVAVLHHADLQQRQQHVLAASKNDSYSTRRFSCMFVPVQSLCSAAAL
jgi:hypothetical protein